MDWRIPRSLWRGAASRWPACLDVERDVVKEGGRGVAVALSVGLTTWMAIR